MMYHFFNNKRCLPWGYSCSECAEPKLEVELSRLSTLEAGLRVMGTAVNTHLGMLRGRASELGVVTVWLYMVAVLLAAAGMFEYAVELNIRDGWVQIDSKELVTGVVTILALVIGDKSVKTLVSDVVVMTDDVTAVVLGTDVRLYAEKRKQDSVNFWSLCFKEVDYKMSLYYLVMSLWTIPFIVWFRFDIWDCKCDIFVYMLFIPSSQR